MIPERTSSPISAVIFNSLHRHCTRLALQYIEPHPFRYMRVEECERLPKVPNTPYLLSISVGKHLLVKRALGIAAIIVVESFFISG